MSIKFLIKNILFIVILLTPIYSYAGKKDIVIRRPKCFCKK